MEDLGSFLLLSLVTGHHPHGEDAKLYTLISVFCFCVLLGCIIYLKIMMGFSQACFFVNEDISFFFERESETEHVCK